MSTPRCLRIAVVQAPTGDGGARETCRLVVHGLSERGHVVEQSVLDGDTAASARRRLDRNGGRGRATWRFEFVRKPFRFFTGLTRFEPDAVLVFGRSGRVLAALAARWIGCPSVVVNPMPHACDLNPAKRALEILLGCSGLFTRIVVDSAELQSAYPRACSPGSSGSSAASAPAPADSPGSARGRRSGCPWPPGCSDARDI